MAAFVQSLSPPSSRASSHSPLYTSSSRITNLFLFKRSNGIWYIHYKENGRSRWKSTKTRSKSDAFYELTEFEKLIQPKPLPARTLSTFQADYLSYAQVNRSRSTVEIIRRSFHHLELIVKGTCPLDELTPEHIDRYKTIRLSHKVSPHTVNMEMRSLRASMNIAVRWKLLKENPFSGLEACKVPEVTPKFLSREEFKTLLNRV